MWAALLLLVAALTPTMVRVWGSEPFAIRLGVPPPPALAPSIPPVSHADAVCSVGQALVVRRAAPPMQKPSRRKLVGAAGLAAFSFVGTARAHTAGCDCSACSYHRPGCGCGECEPAHAPSAVSGSSVSSHGLGCGCASCGASAHGAGCPCPGCSM